MSPAALVAVSCVSGILGLLFNGYILLVLVSNRQVRTANNLMLLHLGLVDCVFCVQILASAALHSGWLAWDAMHCAVHGFVWTALLPVLVWSLAGLNCDRYCAIVTPLHYSRLVHTKRVLFFFAVTWVAGVGLAFPPLLHVNPYAYREARGGCTADFTDTSSGLWYGFVYATATLFVPSVLMLFCNVRIFMIARFQRHRIVSAIYEITLRAHATITHQSHPCDFNKFRGRGAILTLLQLVISLVLLYGPYFGVLLSEVSTKRPHTDLVVTVATALVTCSPPTHGFVYGVKSRVLRKTFRNFLRRQLYQSEVNSEIQRQASRRASVQHQVQPSLQTSRRQASDHLVRRTLQRRMSEILNISPKVNPHRRLSEFSQSPPTVIGNPSSDASLSRLDPYDSETQRGLQTDSQSDVASTSDSRSNMDQAEISVNGKNLSQNSSDNITHVLVNPNLTPKVAFRNNSTVRFSLDTIPTIEITHDNAV